MDRLRKESLILRPGLCASVFAIAVSGAIPLQGAAFRRGDADGNERLEMADAIAVFGFLFLGGPPPGCLDAADANDDGTLDITDGIAVLSFLFLGGPPPPPPSVDAPCPGEDPTADSLPCHEGLEATGSAPEAELLALLAPPRGVRQRDRRPLPTGPGGEALAREGESFVLLVEARRNETTRAALSLIAGDPPAGDAGFLDVRCDRDLGDPGTGGIPAGANLAAFFGRDLDAWSDPIYLLDHVGLRFPSSGPWAPAAGEYRFTVRVTDAECATSMPASLNLRVEPSRRPRLEAWVEDGPAVDGEPIQHQEGSGNARLEPGGGYVLAVALHAGAPGGPEPDPATLRVTADPPFGAGADLTQAFAAAAGLDGVFALALEPPWTPRSGNTTVRFHLDPAGGEASGEVSFVLEVPVDYAAEVQPLWNLHCTGCHERPDPFRGLELVTADPERSRRNIVHVFATEPVITSTAPRLVRPYLPEKSYLWRKLEGTHLDPAVGGEGDRMPLGGGWLAPEEMRIVRSWIEQGAK